MQAAKLLSYSLESNKCCLAKICWDLLIQKAQLEQKARYQKQLKFSFACLMQAYEFLHIILYNKKLKRAKF